MNNLPNLTPQQLTCGYFDCSVFKNAKVSPLRISSLYEIEFFIEDAGITFLNDDKIKIRADHIIIGRPDDVRYSQLPFKTMFLKFEASDELANILNKLPRYFEVAHKKSICELWHEIIAMSENEINDPVLLSGKFFTLLALIIKDGNRNVNIGSHHYAAMRQAKKFIEAHYAEHISTLDIAMDVNLSESRLRYLFNETFGISPHTHLINTRVSAAKELLWNTDYSIIEIAEKCGFGCQQRLNNIFKNVTGISPGKYRKQFAAKYIK